MWIKHNQIISNIYRKLTVILNYDMYSQQFESALAEFNQPVRVECMAKYNSQLQPCLSNCHYATSLLVRLAVSTDQSLA